MVNNNSEDQVEFSWECDDCFTVWEDEEPQLICPVCGSIMVHKSD